MRYMIAFIVFLGIFTFNSSLAQEPTEKISLRDKIGQMLIVGFNGTKIDAHSNIVKTIMKNNIGGVILFDYDARTERFDRNIASPTQVKRLNEDLQKYNQKGNSKHDRPNLPLIISVDYEGGTVNRLKENYGFPKTFSAEKVGKKSINEAEEIAESMAQTLKRAGFNVNFAPVLDVNVNPENPIIGKLGRSFSEDAPAVTNYASIFTRHYLTNQIQCAYKHFPGHGSSTKDSHLDFVDVTDTWKTEELIPYQQLLPQDPACGMVMTAHLVNRQLDPSGLPATLSYSVLTNLLREKMHFNGVIITDDMQMKAISDHYSLEKALVLAVNAGADMFIFGNNLSDPAQNPNQVIDIIEKKVQSGEISKQRINQSYERIVKLKNTLIL